MLNTTTNDAQLKPGFYVADREPYEDDPEQVDGYTIPLDTPYGVRVRRDVPVIVQYSRMYTTTHNISLMTTMACAVE